MKSRSLVSLTLLSAVIAAVVGCGSSSTTVTPVKDTTPVPTAQPESGGDST